MKKIINNIEVLALVYKSVDYLKMIHRELVSEKIKVDGWDVSFRIVANDATHEVLEYLKENDINHSIYKDPKPQDFYLNRVYRCWNYAGNTSNFSNICFVNSDMVFSKNWLTNLLKYHDGTKIPCSRLVESGKMPSGTHGISMNFGRHPNQIKNSKWEDWAEKISVNKIEKRGLFMPCVFETKTFKDSGGYPEGNIFIVGGKLEAGHPNNMPFYMSGDKYYFERLKDKYQLEHITVFDSLVYHIQEGEKDEE